MEVVRWLDTEEARAWRGFVRMHTQLTAELNRRLQADSGISDSDFGVMVILSEAPDRRMRVRELGFNLQWEKSRLSHHLTRMSQRGLVERQECSSDARGAFAVLTDAGFEAVKAAAPPHVEAVRRFLIDLLSPEEIAVLGDISEAVVSRLKEERENNAGCAEAAGATDKDCSES